MKFKSFADLARHLKVAQERTEPEVIVSPHAVERMRDFWRLGAEVPTEEEAVRFLTKAALKGQTVRRCPDGALEVCYQEIWLVVKKFPERVVVVTCNGDRTWRNWYKKHHVDIRFRAKARAAL